MLFLFLISFGWANIDSLSPENITEYISGNDPIAIKFYTPDCPYCMELAPHFEKISSLFNNVKFGQVDCDKYASLCDEYEIFQYPQIKVKLANSQFFNYDGEHEPNQIIDFIEKKTGRISKRPLLFFKPLTPYDFDKQTKNKLFSMILFSTPDGAAVNNSLYSIKELARAFQLEKNVTICAINCESYRAFCREQNIQKDPTIIELYQGKRTIYTEETDPDKMLAYINNKISSRRERSGLLDETVGLVENTKLIIEKFIGNCSTIEEKQAAIEEMKKVQGADFYVRVMQRIVKDGIEKIFEITEEMQDLFDAMSESPKILDSIRPKYNVYQQFLNIYSKIEDDKLDNEFGIPEL